MVVILRLFQNKNDLYEAVLNLEQNFKRHLDSQIFSGYHIDSPSLKQRPKWKGLRLAIIITFSYPVYWTELIFTKSFSDYQHIFYPLLQCGATRHRFSTKFLQIKRTEAKNWIIKYTLQLWPQVMDRLRSLLCIMSTHYKFV